MLSINNLLIDAVEGKTYRILWIDSESDTAYVIELSKSGLPYTKSLSQLEMQVRTGSLTPEADELLHFTPEPEISDRDKAFRDTAWKIIEHLVNNEPAIYKPATRGPLITAAEQASGVTKKTIYKYLRWYWERGKVKNALLPNIKNRGGKGIPKKAAKEKLGRPRKYGEGTGRNVDEEMVCIFEQAIKRFYHTRQEHTFTAAYNLMLKEYFTEKVDLPGGDYKLQLMPQDELPTLRQFRYWYSKTYDTAVKIRTRKGDSAFERNHRAVLGKSDTHIAGPGSQYQIDATVGDIYLVSRFNRANIIGRPVIYFVIDTFSRMIAGMYVGLEGPSWTGAMMALCNAASDKVAFCREYGIEIEESQWPCRYIPDTIFADRGEMESKSVETLINTLNIRVDNAPPYRADMKGIVEQFFRTVNTKTTVFLPGYVKPDMLQRGGHDYRLDAKLDLSQFTRIIIQCVLNHNNEHYLDGYERTEDMIEDDVLPVPIKLWQWGISHRSGALRSAPEKTLRLCLMPTGTATVTGKGIRFKGLVYLCERAVREHWFENARAKGSFRVKVSYDPRNMSSIYIWETAGSLFEPCFLAEWETKYQGKSLDEIYCLQEAEKQERSRYAPKQAQSHVDLNAEIEKIVCEAEEMAKQTPMPTSKASRISGIRENRAAEKLIARHAEAFTLEEDDPEKAEDSAGAEGETLSPTLSMIKRKLEERLDDV